MAAKEKGVPFSKFDGFKISEPRKFILANKIGNSHPLKEPGAKEKPKTSKDSLLSRKKLNSTSSLLQRKSQAFPFRKGGNLGVFEEGHSRNTFHPHEPISIKYSRLVPKTSDSSSPRIKHRNNKTLSYDFKTVSSTSNLHPKFSQIPSLLAKSNSRFEKELSKKSKPFHSMAYSQFSSPRTTNLVLQQSIELKPTNFPLKMKKKGGIIENEELMAGIPADVKELLQPLQIKAHSQNKTYSDAYLLDSPSEEQELLKKQNQLHKKIIDRLNTCKSIQYQLQLNHDLLYHAHKSASNKWCPVKDMFAPNQDCSGLALLIGQIANTQDGSQHSSERDREYYISKMGELTSLVRSVIRHMQDSQVKEDLIKSLELIWKTNVSVVDDMVSNEENEQQVNLKKCQQHNKNVINESENKYLQLLERWKKSEEAYKDNHIKFMKTIARLKRDKKTTEDLAEKYQMEMAELLDPAKLLAFQGVMNSFAASTNTTEKPAPLPNNSQDISDVINILDDKKKVWNDKQATGEKTPREKAKMTVMKSMTRQIKSQFSGVEMTPRAGAAEQGTINKKAQAQATLPALPSALPSGEITAKDVFKKGIAQFFIKQFASALDFPTEKIPFLSKSSPIFLQGEKPVKVEALDIIEFPVSEATQTEDIDLEDDIEILNSKDVLKKKAGLLGLSNPLAKIVLKYKEKQTGLYNMENHTLFKILENMIEDKYEYDYACETSETLSDYIYERLIMKYGLKTIAIKMVLSFYSTLRKSMERTDRYSVMLLKLFGLHYNSYEEDQKKIIIRAVHIFNSAQDRWKSKNPEDYTNIKKTERKILDHGGYIPVIGLIDHILSNTKHRITVGTLREQKMRKSSNRFSSSKLISLTSECLKAQQPTVEEDLIKNLMADEYFDLDNADKIQKYLLKFSVYKMCHSLSKTHKTLKEIFTFIDRDHDGFLNREELAEGLLDNFNAFLSYKEINKIVEFLDVDGNDKIDVEEFSRLYIEIEQNFELYLISKFRFLEVVLEQLQIYTDIEKKKIMKLFKDYDENHDGVLTLNEFEVLIRNIAPSMPMMACTKLFRETLDSVDSENPDEMSPEAFCDMIHRHNIGGIGIEFFSSYHENAKREKTGVSMKRSITIPDLDLSQHH